MHACLRQTDRRTDEHDGNSATSLGATIRSNEGIALKTEVILGYFVKYIWADFSDLGVRYKMANRIC